MQRCSDCGLKNRQCSNVLAVFRRQQAGVPTEDLSVIQRCCQRISEPVLWEIRVRRHPRLNPCPCGFFGDSKRECRCGPPVIQRYRQRISGPLLDRIDLHVEVPLVDYKALSSSEPGESSAAIRARVEQARAVQAERFRKNAGVHINSAMTPRLIKQHCQLDAEAAGYLEHAMSNMNFSARAHDRILKVARTLADLAGSERIRPNDVLEAIGYRALDRNLWA